MLARCYVEISRSQIAANYRAVRDSLAGVAGAGRKDAGGLQAGVIGVVKADAYGHGAIEVARVLRAEGAGWLAVSSVDEGIALRRAGLDCRILVMAGVMKWEEPALWEFQLTPVAHSLEDFRRFEESGLATEGQPLRVHLKIDTGMNRLGTRADAGRIAETIAGLKKIEVEGLMSHFASAADFSSGQTEDQIRAFTTICEELATLGFRPAVRHFASTNAVAYPRPGAAMSLVRPGHAIYGYVSSVRGHAPVLQVKPALSWRTRIVSVKDVPAGAKVGYGGSFVAPAPMRLAVLAAGYADGVPHRLSNRGKVIAGGQFAPIVGTVSMDLTTVDLTHAPWMQPGDVVTLLGREGEASLDAQQIARTAGTISYNVLCGISGRVKRFYTA